MRTYLKSEQQSSLRCIRPRTVLAAWPLLVFALAAARVPSINAAPPQDSPKSKKVYTNDDFPFNRPRPGASSSEPEAGSPGAVPSEGQRLAPFVPSPETVVEKMLDVALVTPADVVYDLGSGDGRIVILAAQKYGARGVGIELDRSLAQDSKDKVEQMKLGDRVSIIQGDVLQANLKPATVVTIYLLVSANELLRPILERDLAPGTRVVAHDMRVPGWTAAREVSVDVGGATHFIYLYRVPEAFRK